MEKNKEKQVPAFENVTSNSIRNIRLEDFFYIKKISSSQFGNVHMIRDNCGNFYALKSFNKSELIEYEVQKFISEEKKILEEIAFPFIIELGKVFQTEANLYFIMEYIAGENFYDVIKDLGLLSTEDSQFYIASIILIL